MYELGRIVTVIAIFFIFAKSMDWSEKHYKKSPNSGVPSFIKVVTGISIFIAIALLIGVVFRPSEDASMFLTLIITWPSVFLYNLIAVKLGWKIPID